MWVRQSFDKQEESDPEWLREFTIFLNKNGNKKKFMAVKKIFVEAYLENISEGMNPKEAMQKAKAIALCFLILQD